MRTSKVCVGLLAAFSLPTHAEDDLTLVGSLAFQSKQLSFDQTYSGSNQNRANFEASIPMVNLGLTAVYQRFFVALKMEKSLSVTSTGTSETDRALLTDFEGNPAPESNLLTHPGGSIDLRREDASFTVGVNVWRRLNLFTGYIYGKTVLNPDPFCANPFPTVNPALSDDDPAVIACSQSNRAFAQFLLGRQPLGLESAPDYLVENQAAYEQTYTEKGLFFGASYAFKIEDYGTLALSLAYAILDGKYTDNANDPNNGFSGAFFPFRFTGDTTGTSLALTWTGSLSARTAYTVDLRRQAYDLEAESRTEQLEGLKLDTEEEMLGLTVGIQVYF